MRISATKRLMKFLRIVDGFGSAFQIFSVEAESSEGARAGRPWLRGDELFVACALVTYAPRPPAPRVGAEPHRPNVVNLTL